MYTEFGPFKVEIKHIRTAQGNPISSIKYWGRETKIKKLCPGQSLLKSDKESAG